MTCHSTRSHVYYRNADADWQPASSRAGRANVRDQSAMDPPAGPTQHSPAALARSKRLITHGSAHVERWKAAFPAALP
jgi:hypothetical protein